MEQAAGRKTVERTEGENRAEMTVGGSRSRRSQAGTQRVAITIAHIGVDGGRRHGGDLADNMTDRVVA